MVVSHPYTKYTWQDFLLGGGAMAQAIAGGILESKTLGSESIHASATSNRSKTFIFLKIFL